MRLGLGLSLFSAAPLSSPAPTFASITADEGPDYGGTSVTIEGTGFQVGVSVTIAGLAVGSLVRVSDTELTCTTPAKILSAATSDEDVVITNPDTQSVTGTDAFTYNWTPYSLDTQLEAWWDPSDSNNATQVSSEWSQWADKSGNGYTATQANSAIRMGVGTINGLNVGTFDTSASDDGWLACGDFSALTAGEMYAIHDTPVLASSTGGGFHGFYADAVNITQCLDPYIDANKTVYDNFGTTVRKSASSDGVVDFATPHVYRVTSTSSEWTNYVNNTQIQTTGTNTVGFGTACWLGARIGIQAAVCRGSIGEVVITNAKLSAGNATLLKNYLYAKWGITP